MRSAAPFACLDRAPLPDRCKYVTLAALAGAVGRSRSWGYARADAGDFPTVKLRGIGLRVRLADAIAYIESLEETKP